MTIGRNLTGMLLQSAWHEARFAIENDYLEENIMATSIPSRRHNFDPNSYEAPRFRRDRNGRDDPTTYQAAMGLRKFMHDKNLPFISRDNASQAALRGSFTVNGRQITVNEQERAMFRRINSQGLFNRLDAGTTNSQDGWIGVRDINAAIGQSWKLHGAERSRNQQWRDPATQSRMTTAEAKQVVNNMVQNSNMHYLMRGGINEIINNQSHRDRNGRTVSADPRLISALYMLGREFDEVNTDGNHYLDRRELREWEI